VEDDEASVYYKWPLHEFLADGTLRIRTSGYRGSCLFSGINDAAPDSPDFAFWMWIINDRKPMRRSRSSGKESASVHGSELEALREEYRVRQDS